MNKKILIFIFLTPCYIQSKLDDWKPSNTGLNAVKELTKGALKVVAAVATIVYAPTTYTAARDTISPPPDVCAQSKVKKVRDCFQKHAGDSELTPHRYPIACRQHLIGFILARNALETSGGNLDTVPTPQDLINEFQHYRRNP